MQIHIPGKDDYALYFNGTRYPRWMILYECKFPDFTFQIISEYSYSKIILCYMWDIVLIPYIIQAVLKKNELTSGIMCFLLGYCVLIIRLHLHIIFHFVYLHFAGKVINIEFSSLLCGVSAHIKKHKKHLLFSDLFINNAVIFLVKSYLFNCFFWFHILLLLSFFNACFNTLFVIYFGIRFMLYYIKCSYSEIACHSVSQYRHLQTIFQGIFLLQYRKPK